VGCEVAAIIKRILDAAALITTPMYPYLDGEI
jgi:hypothetical protein